MKAATTKVYKFGRFSLDTCRHLLLKDGFPLQLREKVFDTLVILVEAGGAVVSKDEFMEKIWPDAFVEENSLNRNISELRKALSSGVEDAPYIETVPKRLPCYPWFEKDPLLDGMRGNPDFQQLMGNLKKYWGSVNERYRSS